MSKLILLQGLPASGKTTKAREMLVEYGNAIRVNRDDLRAMLHTGPWTQRKEKATRQAARDIAGSALLDGLVVLIDDTNLHEGTVQYWKQLATEVEASIEMLRLDTPMHECLRRDLLRLSPVGAHVIVGMAMQHRLYTPALGYVICDIDGTVADCTHRRHFVQQDPKNWTGFFEAMPDDTPRQEVIETVKDLQRQGYDLVFVSGRNADYRTQTEHWLWRHGLGFYRALFMRDSYDHRQDVHVKSDIFKRHFPDPSLVKLVIDDRPSVIRLWTSLGLTVQDVGNGEEF